MHRPPGKSFAVLLTASLAACAGDASGPGDPVEATCYQEPCSEDLEVTATSLSGAPVLFRDLDGDGRAADRRL